MRHNEYMIDDSKSASRMDRWYVREVLGAVAIAVAMLLVLGCEQVHTYRGSTEATGHAVLETDAADTELTRGRTNASGPVFARGSFCAAGAR